MTQGSFTVADYLLTRLRQLDVEHVFQIPGDYVKHFTQALEHFEGVSAVGAINELGAAYSADAYARTRGLGAVSLQFGVSTFIALNAIAGAFVERSPVVVISATPGADMRKITDMYEVLYHHSTGHLDADREVYEKVTVRAITLATNEGAEDAIDELLVDAITYKRPVYIACYKEVWGQPCTPPPDEPLVPWILSSPPQELADAVEQAWALLSVAKQPLVLAGVEVLRFDLSELLHELIEASGYLYTTTTLGKTVLDEEGPKFIGTYSDVASIESVRTRVAAADCVLTLGAIITDDYVDFIESKYSGMVMATTAGMRVGYFRYPNVQMKDFMEALLDRFEQSAGYPLSVEAPAPPEPPEPWASNSDPKFDAQPQVVTYNRFFQHLMAFLGEHGLLDEVVWTFGVSSALYVATNAHGLAQGSFLASAAWQIIGYDMGAAAGAQLGSGKRAVSVAGDGGFMEVCQSLSTLARNELDAVIFVMSNQVYAIEQVFVDTTAFELGKQHQFDTFDLLPKWDYGALAKAFGAEPFRVQTVDELVAALPEIFAVEGKPVLVEVVIPQKDLPGQMRRLGLE